MKKKKSKSSYVLALGGGGARGLAHIGVLKVLEREEIEIKAITGTSMGAVIGAMFAFYKDAVEVEGIFRKFLSSQFHKTFGKTFFLLSEDPNILHEPEKTVTRLGKRFLYLRAASTHAIFSHKFLDEAFSYLLPDVRFSDLQIPFACVAADLKSGEEVVLSGGRLLPAVIASSSIPGFVEPAVVGRRVLIDGSAVGTIPVLAARKTFGGKVLAVDVSMNLAQDGPMDTAFEIAMRGAEITGRYLNETQLSEADILIHPKVGRTTWANFDKLDEMIVAGEVSARRMLPTIMG